MRLFSLLLLLFIGISCQNQDKTKQIETFQLVDYQRDSLSLKYPDHWKMQTPTQEETSH